MPGDVVIKALVPANRRAKNGLIAVANGSSAESRAAELLARTYAEAPVERLLVEEKVAIEQELFFSIVLDRTRAKVVALASLEGGVEIEETSAADPGLVADDRLRPAARSATAHVQRPLVGPRALGADATGGRRRLRAGDARLLRERGDDPGAEPARPRARLGRSRDASAVAVGAVMALDDNALARHPELAGQALPDKGWRPPTALEREAMAVADFEPYRGTARFIELEGDIGLLVGGGGGSLVFFDAVQRAGGRPACFTEIGGNPSAEKVRRLTRVVLSCPRVRGLLVGHNITNNTQVDLVATGVTQALAELDVDTRRFPVLAREVGTNDEVGPGHLPGRRRRIPGRGRHDGRGRPPDRRPCGGNLRMSRSSSRIAADRRSGHHRARSKDGRRPDEWLRHAASRRA